MTANNEEFDQTCKPLEAIHINGLKLTIRMAELADVPALRCLLNSSYKELADMGLNYTAATQNEETTRERMRRGRAFVLCSESEIIGTILLSKGNHKTLRNTAYIGQFAIAPRLKRMGLGKFLMDHCENLAKKEGFDGVQLDTAVSATHLVSWYKRRGYEVVDTAHWDGKSYDSFILEKLF